MQRSMPPQILTLPVNVLARSPSNHIVLITPCLAVGAYLARYNFTLKTSPPSRFNPNLEQSIPESLTLGPLQTSKEWDIGVKYAEAQNWARTVSLSPRSVLISSLTPEKLMELPGNIATPTVRTALSPSLITGCSSASRHSAIASRLHLRGFRM